MAAPWGIVELNPSSESGDVCSESSSEKPQVKKRRRGSDKARRGKLTMRMPREMPVVRGSAAVGASSSKEAYSPPSPFEAESQEGELHSFRAALREYARTGGGPPPVPAINAATGKACRSRAPTPDPASRGPEKKELDKAEDDKSAVGEKSSVGGSSAVGDESAGRGEVTPKNVLLTSSDDVQKDVDPQWVKKCIS